MYASLREPLAHFLDLPLGPPAAPAGGSAAAVRVLRASPRYLVVRLLRLALGLGLAVALLGTLFLAASVAKNELTAALLLCAGLALLLAAFLGYVSIRLDHDLRAYVLTDRALRVREGAWSLRERTVGYANIQNLEVVQGPLLRLLNVWNLRIEVAGGGAAATDERRPAGRGVVLAGLEDAHALRDELLAHLRATAREAGLGDLDDGTGRAAANARSELRELASAARALRRAAEDVAQSSG